MNYSHGLAWKCDLPDLSLQVTGITGMSHQSLASVLLTCEVRQKSGPLIEMKIAFMKKGGHEYAWVFYFVLYHSGLQLKILFIFFHQPLLKFL
jgi:hypothetical protein